jgi:hypothetical protein
VLEELVHLLDDVRLHLQELPSYSSYKSWLDPGVLLPLGDEHLVGLLVALFQGGLVLLTHASPCGSAGR